MISPLVLRLSNIVLLPAHNSSFVGRLCLQQRRGVYFSLSLAGRELVRMQLSRLVPRNLCRDFGIYGVFYYSELVLAPVVQFFLDVLFFF